MKPKVKAVSLLDVIDGRQLAGACANTPDWLISQGLAVRRHRSQYQQHGNAGKQMQIHRNLQRP
ncbi:hypothetical protein [Paraburkholderia dinghuensis]|uniref:hypothetical protein n=1 Tax=Paraburkholderia dinghuensis TaxID=2305225 RepID=UPI001628D45F|nr:hypothetical protein [Paraburkholderia dinghuensis]